MIDVMSILGVAVGDSTPSEYQKNQYLGDDRVVLTDFRIQHPMQGVYSVSGEYTVYRKVGHKEEVPIKKGVLSPTVITPEIMSILMPDIDYNSNKIVGTKQVSEAFYSMMRCCGDWLFLVRGLQDKGVTLGAKVIDEDE